MRKLAGITFLFMTVLFSSCTKEELGNTMSQQTGKLVLNDLEVSASVSDQLSRATLDTNLPSGDKFVITVKSEASSFEQTLEEGVFECILPVGTYTVKAVYGEDVVSLDTPYFYGETSVEIKEGATAPVSITATLQSAIIRPVMDEALLAQYTDYSLSVSDANNTMTTVANNTDLFVPAGKDYTLWLMGENQLGNQANTSWSLNQLSAKTRYIVSCNADLPSFTFPEQAETNAWSKFIYVTPMTAENMSSHPEMADQVMGPIDYSMASLVHEHLTQKGIKLYLSQAVEAFEQTDSGLNVVFKSGIRLPVDMVILSIGVRAETRLASEAGLKLGEMKGIYVDEYLQTSDENVYAVGDAIEFPHPLTGKPWLNFLAGPANRQARIVADNIAFGNHVKYEGSIGTSIAKVFELTVASTGLPAKRLKQMGIGYLSATIHPASHAGYYPDALQMTIKITFSPIDGKLYGAQIVGYDGADKRIDEFALIIKQGGTVYDLTRLEHAYAPPFSSAKDPVAIAGYVAGNILSGKMTPLYWRELRDADLSQVTLVDVRTSDEFELGSIQEAVNLPLDELREHLNEIPQDKPVWVYCGVGLRGYLASNILKENGFKNVRNLIGGIKTYKAATTPVCIPTETETCSAASNEEMTCACTPDDKLIAEAIKINACGVQCPGPILKLKKGMENLQPGQCIEISATDAGFPRDAESWCRTTGNHFLSKTEENGIYRVRIEKAKPVRETERKAASSGKGKTFILFSDDLDKTLATFVLANGAAATGEKVTIFFTFWGLNAIKKEQKPDVKKDFFGKMFGMMLPSDSRKLKLSKMNMGGIGSKMMRHIMKRKGVDSLESLRRQAIDNGVEFIACQMSMDVMGVKREELLDGVSIGGVATYMDRADGANMNLFI